MRVVTTSPVSARGDGLQVLVPGEGDTIAHSVGSGGVLRIDVPRNPKKEPAAKGDDASKPAEAAKAPKADEKAKEGNK